MAKTKRKPIRGFFRSMVDVPRWVGYSEIKKSTKNLVGLAKAVFIPPKAEHNETFEEAVKRLQMNEDAVNKRMKQYLNMALVYMGVAVLLFAYMLYMLFHGHLLATMVSLVLTALSLTYALREHFWYMQMKRRKLGCTFQDWVGFIKGCIK